MTDSLIRAELRDDKLRVGSGIIYVLYCTEDTTRRGLEATIVKALQCCQCAGRSRAQLYQLISKQTTLELRSNAGFCDSDNVVLKR